MSLRLRRLVLHEVGPFDDLDLVLPEGRDPDRADLHLLVGPNGTGKSTVLSAISRCFEPMGPNSFESRARSDAAYVALDFEGAGWIGARRDAAQTRIAFEPLQTAQPSTVYSWFLHGQSFDEWYDAERHGRPLRFIVFAYGGLRSVDPAELEAIQELTTRPTWGAANPTKHQSMKDFAQWVANTIAREALSARDGDPARAAARRLSLTRVEQAMGEVVGAPVRLRLADDPFRVVMKVGDAEEVPLSQLADGVQSLLSWIGDLLMRMDRVKWEGDVPVTERPFLLLLDEVEVHLHPAWQRRVLPMLERLFPKAQVIVSTHSPFVVNSASDAWIHRFRLVGGKAVVDPPLPSRIGMSAGAVLEDVLGVDTWFDVQTEERLARFRDLRNRRLAGEPVDEALAAEADWLRARSPELATIVEAEWRQLHRRLAASA